MKKNCKKIMLLLSVVLGCFAQIQAQGRAEFIPDLNSYYTIGNADNDHLLTYKGLNGTALFEEASDIFNQAFKFVKAEGDNNAATDEYYIVSLNVESTGVATADLEHLNESGVSKVENSPGWHTVRIFKDASNNTFAIKLVGADANSSSNRRNTLYINGNKLAYRINDANYNQTPPVSDYVFVIEKADIDDTPTVTGVNITGARTLAFGTTTQYAAEVTGAFLTSKTVTWTLSGAKNASTTLSATGLLTVAASETASEIVVKATSDYDNTKSASFNVLLVNPPATPAPTPIHLQEENKVKSIFSDYYTNNGQFVVTYSDWLAESATLPRKDIIAPFADNPSENVLFLDTLINSNVAQISLGAVKLTDLDSIHIDIYSPATDGIGEFDFSFYMGKNDWSGTLTWVQADVWYKITNLKQHGEWISIEVPAAKFREEGEYALVLRLRRGGQGATGSQLFVDNIYAYQSLYVDHTPKINSVTVSGTAALLHGATSTYKATITGTDSPPTDVTWKLEGSTNEGTSISTTGVVTIASDEEAKKLTVTATSVYDNTKSGKLNITLIDPPTMTVDNSVDLTSLLPHCSAPLPRHDPDSVFGIFSDVYSYGQFNLEYDDWLGAGKTACTKEIIYPFESEPVESLLRLDPLYSDNQAQIALGTCNIMGMDSIHIDIYSPGGDEGIGEFDFGLIFEWSGGNHVSANIWLNITEANLHGRWISFDLPLSQFVAYNPNFNVSNINILRLRRGGKGSKGTKLYVDNVYAYKAGCGGVYPPEPEKPEELPPPTTVPSVTVDSDKAISIFCEQLETNDYQETSGIWDVGGSYTLEDDYKIAKMNFSQNANQDREFVEIVSGSGNKTIKLTGWNDYPFKVHKTSETMDLSGMDYLHISVYLANKLVNEKDASLTFLMHDNDGKKLDNTADVASVAMSPGEWVSISIPLCYYEDKLDLSNVYYLRPRLGGYGSMDVFIDNIFAYKGDPIGQVAKDCSEVEEKCDSPIEDKSNGTLPPREQIYLGVNLASASGGTNPGILGTNYRYPKMEDLYYFNAKGLKLIRLPFRWKRVQSTLNGPLVEQDITEMKKVIKEAERLGMWVMLDMHDYCEYSRNDSLFEIGVAGQKVWNSSREIWGSWKASDKIEITKEHFADVWVKLAQAFSDCSNIWGYDLMNEPKGLDINILRDNYQAVIDAIRKFDTETYIVIEGKSYASSSNWPNVSDELKNLTDPANKLVYQAHTYFDSDASGTYQASYDTTVKNPEIYKERFDPFINWCKTNGKIGMIGEFGVPYNGAHQSDERYMDLIDKAFKYLKDNKMTATYWCGGAFYETNHITVQPDKDYCTEKSTMKVMEKYIKDFHLTSIDEVGADKNERVTVYPNPVVDQLNISSKENIVSVRVYNLLGQLISEQQLNNSGNCIVDFSGFATGNYLVRILLQNGEISTKKVTKQ